MLAPRSAPRRRWSALLAALVLVLVPALASCGDESTPAESSSDPHNDADVAFATGMIPHHAQALHMVEMADDRATSPEFRRLLDDIEAAQGPEIERMAGWLQGWDETVPPTNAGADHGSSDSSGHAGHGASGTESATTGMPGMVGQAALERLDQAEGPTFERLWLRLMIEHHEGAVAMAQQERRQGRFPEALDLADEVIEAQQAEIELMEDLVRR